MNIKTTPLENITVAAEKTHVRHAVEGTDPKTGQKMRQVELTGCHTPQKVWFSPASRVALPIKE